MKTLIKTKRAQTGKYSYYRDDGTPCTKEECDASLDNEGVAYYWDDRTPCTKDEYETYVEKRKTMQMKKVSKKMSVAKKILNKMSAPTKKKWKLSEKRKMARISYMLCKVSVVMCEEEDGDEEGVAVAVKEEVADEEAEEVQGDAMTNEQVAERMHELRSKLTIHKK